MSNVTITAKQKKRFVKVGDSLIDSKITVGYQLEDYDPKLSKKKVLTYAHDNPGHLRMVQNHVKGGVNPRESHYLWNTSWKPGTNTHLSKGKTRAYSREEYITTPYTRKKWSWLQSHTFNKSARKPIADSNTLWTVPDIRFFNTGAVTHTRKAYQVTVPIDKDSRFSTVISKKKELVKARKALRGESVQTIRVQHKHYVRKGVLQRGGKDSSFYTFINWKLNLWKKGKVV